MIKNLLMSLSVVALMSGDAIGQEAEPSTGNVYGGVQLGLVDHGNEIGGAFAGYEDVNGMYYAGEVGVTFGNFDSYTFDAKLGVPVLNGNGAAYAVAGYGYGSSNVGSGLRYGMGVKVDLDTRYSVGVQSTWQNRGANRGTEGQYMLRAGLKF